MERFRSRVVEELGSVRESSNGCGPKENEWDKEFRVLCTLLLSALDDAIDDERDFARSRE
jgi:hypothetical protein